MAYTPRKPDNPPVLSPHTQVRIISCYKHQSVILRRVVNQLKEQLGRRYQQLRVIE